MPCATSIIVQNGGRLRKYRLYPPALSEFPDFACSVMACCAADIPCCVACLRRLLRDVSQRRFCIGRDATLNLRCRSCPPCTRQGPPRSDQGSPAAKLATQVCAVVPAERHCWSFCASGGRPAVATDNAQLATPVPPAHFSSASTPLHHGSGHPVAGEFPDRRAFGRRLGTVLPPATQLHRVRQRRLYVLRQARSNADPELQEDLVQHDGFGATGESLTRTGDAGCEEAAPLVAITEATAICFHAIQGAGRRR